MNDFLKEKYIDLKINSKNCYLKVHVSKSELLLDKIAEYISNGIEIIELSGKDVDDAYFLDFSLRVKALCAQFDVTFIISSRVDIAYLSDADGICLSSDDISTDDAKKILPGNFITGSYNSEISDSDYYLFERDVSTQQKTSYFVKYDTQQQDCCNFIIYKKGN